MIRYRETAAAILLLFTGFFLTAQNNDAFLAALFTEQWAKAAGIQEQQSKTDPSNWMVWADLANAYNAASRPLDAKTALQQAARLNQNDAYKYILEGRIALAEDRTADAAKLFDKAAKSGRKDVRTHRLIGESWLYGRHRDLKLAADALQDAYKRDHNDFYTLMDLGYYYIATADGGTALTYFDQAQSVMPANALPALMSAVTYKNAKLPEKQLQYLEKAITLSPGFEAAIRQKAELLYYGKRDYEQAAAAYARLLEINPNTSVEDKMAYVNSLFLTKKYDETIVWIEKIIREDSSRNYLRRLAAYSKYETGDYVTGKIMLDDYFAHVDSTKIIPQDYEYYARFLQQDKQDSLAATYFEKAVAMDSSRWELLADIGALRYKTADYQGAVNAYEKRLDSLQTRTALDYYQVGVAHYMLQDSAAYERAAGYFTKVAEIVPDKTTGWLMLAKTLSKLEPDVETHPELLSQFGRAKDAFEHFVSIAEPNPENYKKDLVAAYEYLAYYYLVNKEPDKVASFQEKLIVLDPGNQIAADLVDWLKSAENQD